MLNARDTSIANLTGSELIISALNSLSSLQQKNNVRQQLSTKLIKNLYEAKQQI
jgi:hypothetical protein